MSICQYLLWNCHVIVKYGFSVRDVILLNDGRMWLQTFDCLCIECLTVAAALGVKWVLSTKNSEWKVQPIPAVFYICIKSCKRQPTICGQ